MSTALSIDTTDKIAINGVDLLNRAELSPYQDKELQRYIDEHAHLLSFKDRERMEPLKPLSKNHSSSYSNLSRELSRGASPMVGYNSIDKHFQKSLTEKEPVYRQIGLNTPQPSPSVDHANYTTDFPGIENSCDNSFLLQFGGKLPIGTHSRPVSSQGNRSNTSYGGSQYNTLASSNGYDTVNSTGTSNYGTTGRNRTVSMGDYGTLGSNSQYGSIGRGVGGGMKGAPSPYNSLKRKGVSWLDQERARSLSPQHAAPQNVMSQYGSTGNLSFRDRTASPAYSTLGKHRDDYNRFETQRHAEAKKAASPFEESRFGGFGDRPGSGVELSSHQWNGGEVITDPNQVPKSLKPRKFYYSPIGDGTVAADGYELKRRPVDLSPRVTITQLQHVDRGEKGRDGLNVYEKSWTNTLGSAPSEGGYGSEYGPGSGRNSRAGAFSPSGGNGLGGSGGPGSGYGPGGPGSGLGGPGSGLGGPGSGLGGPGSGLGGPGSGYGHGGPGSGAGDPFGGGRPGSGLGNNRDPYGSNGQLPNDGRASVASSGFSDPSYKFDMKTGYLITNPRELIHQYATTTPIAVMDPTDNTPTTMTISKQSMYRKTEETTEERFSPYAPYKSANPVQSPNKFVRQLRDDTMTHSQREANTHLDPVNQRDPHAQEKIQQITRKTYTSRSGHDDIDALTNQLVSGLQTGTPVASRF